MGILKLVFQETCVSAFCNIIYTICAICSVPENIPRFLKNVLIFLNSDI